MIAFLQPLALLGLAAAAIPPLLHLWGRRLPPTVPFPAVRYLAATERAHSRRLKLRHLLLMALRTATIALVVLAAAQPVARVGWGDRHPPTAVALVVDNSLSSGATSGGKRLLEFLAEPARELIARATVDDRLWLVLADGIPRRVTRAEAAAVLDTISPWPLRLDLGEAVRAAGRALAGEGLHGAEAIVLSDLQASALAAGDRPATRVLVWEPPVPAPENRGIDSAHAEPRLWSPEGSVAATLGGSAAGATAVRLVVEGREVARTVAAAGDRVVLQARAPARGRLTARVELDPDELRADDGWWLAIHAADPARARAGTGAGPFTREALAVLESGERVALGDAVVLDDRLAAGATILFPPGDPALVGAVNRALAARGVTWRFGDVVAGEWVLSADLGPAAGTPVYRRYRLVGDGAVLARAGGEPWLVRGGDVVIVASRMDEAWTALPVSAGFIPFLDFLINRVAARQSWIVRASPGTVVDLPPEVDGVIVGGTVMSVPSDGRAAVPHAPGVYFLRAGADTIGALEVNHDRRESRLARADAPAVRAALGGDAMLLATGGLYREALGGARHAALSGVLLGAALLTALAELALATVGGRRGRESDAAPAG